MAQPACQIAAPILKTKGITKAMATPFVFRQTIFSNDSENDTYIISR